MIGKDKKRGFKGAPKREQPEFEQNIVEISRVTRVMAGGKRLSFRACVVIGDRKGRVGLGVAKAKDVPMAVQKAVKQAEKSLIKVGLREGTITHEVKAKFGSARILLKPAPVGTGIISGGAVRIVLELAGIENIVSKIFGTNNKINNIKATLQALSSLKKSRFSKKDLKKEEKPVAKEKKEEK
ncbi:MAG: 30S ribosomal protein S5 [Parcubacteria group bacterium ADurb.Bin326]|nr:MAG: 30S ribosomal protein S5 [Parcubacteria group bacterium ADurb.Bin326]